MDMGWIQVFVLTLSECVAPAGKTVCQEQDVHYRFLVRNECEAVLGQLVAYKASQKNIIVDEKRSNCLPTADQQTVFSSVDEANKELAGTEGWGTLPARAEQAQNGPPSADTESSYRKRLESLPECDNSRSVTPCKEGPIIIEGDKTKEVEVWRKDEG